MVTLTIIVGMGGSGKSYFGKDLAKRERIKHFFEDFTVPSPDCRRAGFKGLGETVFRLLQGDDCIVDESHLTVTEFREDFRAFLREFLPNVEQRWIFFENDPLSCINNAYKDYLNAESKRDHIGRLKALNNQRQCYKVPDPTGYQGFQRKDVYDGNPHFADESAAISWLQQTLNAQ